jgi:hypothetical protein
MEFRDSLTLDASGLRFTNDGFLVGDAKVSRAGNVQLYLGAELGLTDERASKPIGVYRDPNTVFDEKSMMSLAGRPVTRGHPAGVVTAANWKDLSVGQMGGVIRRDGEHVVAPMAIMDHAAAKEIEAGARSLSAGYTVSLVADEGVAEDGTPYQFRQAGPLRFNHVAYLPDNNPRAGNTRFGDAAGSGASAPSWGIAPLHDHTPKEPPMADLTTVVVGDSAVQIAASDAAKLEAFKASMTKALADAENAHTVAVAAKDEEIAKAHAALDDAKGKILSDADLDKRVQDRGDLVALAGAIAKDVKTTGVSDADIRKAVVVAKLGDAAVEGKSAAYVDARFDILAEDAKKGADPVARALADGKPAPVTDNGQTAYEARLGDAWKGAK